VLTTAPPPTKQSPSPDDESKDALDTEPTDTPDNERCDYVAQELRVLAEHAKKSEGPCDIATSRERVRGKLLSLISQTETCQDKEALQQLEKQLNSAQSLFRSLQNRNPLKKYS